MEAHEAFERFEKSHETGHGGSHEVSFASQAALGVAILAAFLAVATFLANEAIKEAIQGQTKVADASSKIQSANTQSEIAHLNAAVIESLAAQGGPPAKALDKIGTDLEHQTKTQIDPLSEEATKERDKEHKNVAHANDQHLRYELAEVGLQIGIVLASVSIIARRRWLLWGGGAMGTIGVVILGIGLAS
jgi:hypothetical protein